MVDDPNPVLDWTPSNWTRHLRSIGMLHEGQVDEVRLTPVDGPFGKTHRLFQVQAWYSGVEPGLPHQFFLKFGKSRKEPFFYNRIAPAMPGALFARCYAARYDAAQDQACLLLEDLSSSYTQPEWPLPPADEACAALVRALGRLHAHWWQDPRLEEDFRPAIPQGRAWTDRRAVAIRRLPDFLHFLGSRLPASHAAVYRAISDSGASPCEAPSGAPHQTLLHGDAHTWNAMYAHAPAQDIRLIDWNMWDVGSPADDLAYMMTIHWRPERRSRLEAHLLAIYHTALVEGGACGYSMANLQQDYRAAVVRSLLTPAWQWVRGIAPGVWWPHLERIFLAFEDLDCADLLG